MNDFSLLEPKAVLILIASESEIEIAAIPDLACSYNFPVYGVVCAGVIYSNQYSYDGVLVLAFDVPLRVSLIDNLNLGREYVEQVLESYASFDCDHGTSMVFIDGMSERVESFVRTFYEQIGHECNVLGGGAGYKSFEALPCIADKHGCYSNAVLILSVPNGRNISSVGAHGWNEIAGPILITSAQDNKVTELNYHSAFEVYRQAVSDYADIELTPENFSKVATAFPFGLKQLDAECLVRDPSLLDGESLRFVGNMEENSLVYVLHSNQVGLVEAANQAAVELASIVTANEAESETHEVQNILVIDCISRALFLGDAFQQELDSIRGGLPGNSRMLGILSLGEIKGSDQGAIQFLNKTLVLGGI
jgi:hypothetical protein